MSRSTRTTVLLAILGLMVSFLTVIPAGLANADSIPQLTWSAPVALTSNSGAPITSPGGDVTLPCMQDSSGGGRDLTTYNSSGGIPRQLSRATMIDGVPNCIGS